ncbi:GumC family protein [Nitrospinota bacterium]
MNTSTTKNPRPRIVDFTHIVLKRKWLVGMIFIVITSITTIWSFTSTPYYRASSQILIERSQSNVVPFVSVASQREYLSREYLLTQIKFLQSRNLATRVARKLELSKEIGFGIPYKKKKFSLQAVSNAFIQSLAQWIQNLIGNNSSKDPATIERKIRRSPEELAIENLKGRLLVRPVRLSNLVFVSFDDPDPAMAAKVANGYGEQFLQMVLELRFSGAKDAAVWLSKEIKKVRLELLNSDRKLQNYKEKYNLISLEDRQNIIAEKLTGLNNAMTKAKTEKISVEVLFDKVQQANGDNSVLSSLPDVIQSPVIQKLKGEQNKLLREHSKLSKKYKSRHPKLVRLISRIEFMDKRIKEEKQEIAINIKTRYQVALAKERSLSRSVEQQKQEALRLSRIAVVYNALLRDIETGRELYKQLLKRTKETNLIKSLGANTTRVIDKAQIPTRPEYPNKRQNIIIAAVSSLILGVLLAVFLDHIDTRIRTPEEVESITNAPLVGVISEFKKGFSRESRSIEEPIDKVLTREHFRELQTMTLFRLGEKHKVVQITSSIPREGKTFVSSHLCLGLSEVKDRVLLIDGDIHRSGVHDYFDIPQSPGLIEMLMGGATFENCLYEVSGTNLTVMPSGGRKSISTRLFETNQLNEIVSVAKESFNIIIVDTPPLLILSDPLIWAPCVDGILYVVDVQQVTSNILNQAVEKLHEIEKPILGSIMNRMTVHHNYYYYGYDKKYSYYYTGKNRSDDN